jgi:hypothetical protein
MALKRPNSFSDIDDAKIHNRGNPVSESGMVMHQIRAFEWAISLEQNRKSFLGKVAIVGQNLLNSRLPHYYHRNAIYSTSTSSVVNHWWFFT